MTDLFFKLKVLFKMILYTVKEWKECVWSVECLDEPFCCYPTSYSPCGCNGDTRREQLIREYFNR